MKKPLFYRLFGVGGFPQNYAFEIKNEGIILSDEGVKGSVTYIDFRAPGRYSSWRRQWYISSIAITNARLLATRGSNPTINVPLTDPRLKQFEFSVEKEHTLVAAFDPSIFHDNWSGKIEYRFVMEQAQAFLNKLNELTK